MKDFFKFLIILIFGVYNYHLFSTNQLGIYISQRFFDFSFITSLVAISVSLVGMLYLAFINRDKIKKCLKSLNFNNTYYKLIVLAAVVALAFIININLLLICLILSWVLLRSSKLKPSLTYIVLIIAIGVMVLIPPKSLSSITAFQRESDFNSVTLDGDPTPIQAFANTDNYNLGEWISAISYNPDLNSYIGKSVKVSGFVFPKETFGDDMFLVSRFVVTCCAVDARPLGLPVQFNWRDNFKVDDWVEVLGKFDVQNINDREQLVIIAEGLRKIDIPSNPYIY